MSTSEPLQKIFELTVLGDSPATISQKLSDMGITMEPERIKKIQKRWEPEIIQWVRQEYVAEVGAAIFDYRQKIQRMMAVLERRFFEADQSYEDFKDTRNKTFSALLEEYRADPAPDLMKYLTRANAMAEGMNLQKLARVLKEIHGEQAKLLELAAKLDAKLQATSVTNNNEFNVTAIVDSLYNELCADCKIKLTEKAL